MLLAYEIIVDSRYLHAHEFSRGWRVRPRISGAIPRYDPKSGQLLNAVGFEMHLIVYPTGGRKRWYVKHIGDALAGRKHDPV